MKLLQHKTPFQKTFWTLGGAVFTAFAGVVILAVLLFRSHVREQVMERDRQLLHNVAQHLYESTEPIGIPDWDLLELAADSSQIKNVIGIRLFGPEAEPLGLVPQTLIPVRLEESALSKLRKGHSLVRYHDTFSLDTLFVDWEPYEADPQVPILEILIPVRNANGQLAGFVQYWLDGTAAKQQFAGIDRYLLSMGMLFIGGGGLIFAVMFILARGRLLKLARIIEERNASLEKANRDLALAARTSAIGTVASHLFHGLKNPLAGLKAYLRLTQNDGEALAITDKMQSLIEESLSVLRDQEGLARTTVSVAEFRELLQHRVGEGADAAGRLTISIDGEASIEATKAQLLLLIIRNLVENALEAAPAPAPVRVDIKARQERLRIQIKDNGPGLPANVRERLFQPITSAKVNGSGLGLALSAALSRHLPASLELLFSGTEGTAFEINLNLPS